MLGNRTDVNENGTVTSYYSNSLNQYTSVGGTGFSHDKNGNVIDDGLYKYYYDCENRLTDVNDQSDNRVASYKYDYLGRRIKKIVYGSPNVVTKYCYDGGRVVTEYNGNDNLKLAYVYGAGIDEPVCFYNYSTWTTYYFHYDGLGNVIAISDDYQDIEERYEYDVYGECTVHTDAGQDGQWMTADDTTDTESAAGNPYLFTGRRYDPETALYYYRARYYDYSTGRFLQTDPIGYEGGKSLYAYVDNNPLNFIDPFGNVPINLITGKNYIINTESKTCSESTGPGIGERIAADLYESGHAIQGATYAIEYVLTEGVILIIKPASKLGHLGDEVVIPPTGYTPEMHIPTKFISTVAEGVDLALGDWLRAHARDSLEAMRWHWEQEW